MVTVFANIEGMKPVTLYWSSGWGTGMDNMPRVPDGTVDWPKDQTEVADFFKYLKGNDGKDGKDGKSAFDQWKDMIADGSVDIIF